MSGGHFNYKQHVFRDIANDIQELIDKNNVTDEFGFTYNYSKDILQKFSETIKVLHIVEEMVHRVDWLVSGDDGEKTFRELWSKKITELLDENLYCPECGSCGEEGCCPPDICVHLKENLLCLYGLYYAKTYKELLDENTSLREEIEGLKRRLNEG